MIEPGDVLLGRYEIRKLAGHGGMADVYLAYDRKRRTAVAVKVLHEDLAEDPEFVRRFEREAEALARLDHPNIVRFYGFEQQGRVAFIVMDYIAGSTLRGRLRDANGPLPMAEVRSILEQVVAALHYAHDSGLIHRDIKPGNIMLKEDGTALLSDFGIARVAEATTLTAGPLGTPPYMSPEQILGQAVDERTDVYSLGVVAFEMLAGRRPFVGESTGAPSSSTSERIRWEHLHGTPTPLRQLNPSVPAGAEAAVMRALAKTAADRWTSIAAFWDALGPALPGEGLVPVPAASPPPTTPLRRAVAAETSVQSQSPSAPPVVLSPSPRRLSVGLLAAGGAVLVGIFIIGLWAWPRGLLDLGGRNQGAWTPAAISERALSGSSTPGDAGRVIASAVSAANNATTSPGTAFPEMITGPQPGTTTPPVPATPLASATPRPPATQPPTSTPTRTATPLPTSTPTATATAVTPTPVVGKVVFGSDRTGFAHIFTVRGNGQGLRAITSGSEYFWDPVLSGDGTLAAYVSKINGNTEIFVARSDGSNARPISNHPAEDDHPAWFPNNRELAFASRRDGGWDIYRMNADGSNVRRLTADGGDNRLVAISPDGAQIAYVSQNAGYPRVELMLINADGSNRRVLYNYTSHKQRDDPGRFLYRPDWSPDGTEIAFGADDDDDGLISVLLIDAASGQARRLIRDGNGPTWSPDGLRFIYKPDGERQILFVADASGNRLYQLTASDYNAWSPDWAR